MFEYSVKKQNHEKIACCNHHTHWLHDRNKPVEDQKGFRTYQEVLTELINDAPMKTYRDSFYGYSIRYPEFFSQEITDKGFVRLGYWDNERFVIECSVLKART